MKDEPVPVTGGQGTTPTVYAAAKRDRAGELFRTRAQGTRGQDLWCHLRDCAPCSTTWGHSTQGQEALQRAGREYPEEVIVQVGAMVINKRDGLSDILRKAMRSTEGG